MISKRTTHKDTKKKSDNLEQISAERNKTADRLLQSEARYRNILETIEEGYYEVDLAGNFIFFNNSLCRIFDRSPEELMGMNNRAYTSAEAAKRIFLIFNEIYRKGVGAKILDYEVIRKDSSVIMLEGSASLLKDSSGKPIGFHGIIRERTQLKKIEKTLRESEAKHRHILETIEEGYWEIDLTGKFTFFNDAFVKICQVSHDELLGLNPLSVTSAAETKRITEIFGEVYRTGVPAKVIDYEVTLRDGSIMIVEMSVSLLRNAEGVPIGFCGISRDRTEQKMTERALHRSEEKYRHILDSIEEGYYETDLAGNRTFCNIALCKMYGYSYDEMMNMNYRQYSTPETAKILSKSTREVFRTGIPSTIIDHEVKRKDGSIMLVESSIYMLRGESGKPTGFHGMVRDRTKQKKAELALQDSEEKYRLLVENAHDCIYIIQDGAVKFSNRRTEELTGYSAAELSKIQFTDLIHPKDRALVIEQQQKNLPGGKKPAAYSFRLINKNDEILWAELRTVEIVWDGCPATLNFLSDITPQKKAEAQFLQAQKMEAVGTLAGGIAHDFNNLLMGIQGNASLMLLNTGTDHPHYARLRSIEQQVQTGAELTRQLLGVARGGKYEVKPTDINQLIETGLDVFVRTNKDIVIHKYLQEAVWTVEVDRSQIEQVLLNLYINARYAMPGGGDLYVETRNIILDEDYVASYGVAPGKFVRISVTDTGTGMDEITQKKAFDPFFTTKEMGRGAGLGLASAYGIVKNHGGIINIYSEEGIGTTLKIYLPVSEKDIVEDAYSRPEILGGTELILFVDDQEAITQIGCELLKSLGYGVITAISGKEAIDVYSRDRLRIDLIILDMIMPGLSGGETFDQLKKINPQVKVLLSSGYSISGQARNILDRGCRGFIQKPFNLADLSKKVRQILDEK
jgi:two-component system cell cycle sensor histidine kinase/response regulator CckA